MKKIIAILLGYSVVLNAQDLGGVEWGLKYTGEAVSLLRGGTIEDNLVLLDNIDLQFELSTESMGLWQGGTGFAYFLSNGGKDPSAQIGDAQVTSNIEANNTRRMYELWYNHAFGEGVWELLVGVHDLNSEFYTSEYAGLFNNSSFGIGPDVSANAPVGIFNVAALGARLRYKPNERFTLIGALYDGDPGDPDENSNGLKISWTADQGIMTITEAQFSPNTEEAGKDAPANIYRLGAWYHSAELEGILGGSFKFKGNYGMYFSVDRELSSALSGFAHGGFAAKDRSVVPSYFGFGVNASGLIASRQDDVFGLAVGLADISEGGAREMVIEGTWQMQFGEQFSLKPDLQLVTSPGGLDSSKDVLVFSLRTEIAL